MRTVDDKVVVALHQIRDAIKNKECCGGGSDSSSKEVTIDDIVKFIHDNTTSGTPFPYTKYNEIPDTPINKSFSEGFYKGTLEMVNKAAKIGIYPYYTALQIDKYIINYYKPENA